MQKIEQIKLCNFFLQNTVLKIAQVQIIVNFFPKIVLKIVQKIEQKIMQKLYFYKKK